MNEETILVLVLGLGLLGLGFLLGSYIRGISLDRKRAAELDKELEENRRRLDYMQ